MLPSLSKTDHPHGGAGDTEAPAKFAVRFSTTGPDGNNGGNVKFGVAVSFAVALASLAIAVLCVLGLGSKKQMLKIEARRVIASVQNARPIGYSSMSLFPYKAMNVFGLSLDGGYSVSPDFRSCPFGTTASSNSGVFLETVTQRNHFLQVAAFPAFCASPTSQSVAIDNSGISAIASAPPMAISGVTQDDLLPKSFSSKVYRLRHNYPPNSSIGHCSKLSMVICGY